MKNSKLLSNEYGLKQFQILLRFASAKKTLKISNSKSTPPPLLCLIRAVARTLIGGGGVHIHIFMFCPTDFFSN